MDAAIPVLDGNTISSKLNALNQKFKEEDAKKVQNRIRLN